MTSVKVFVRKEKHFSKCKVYLKIRSFSEVWRYSLNISIDPNDWNKKNNCVGNGATNAIVYNLKINTAIAKLQSIILKLETDNIPPTIKRIKKELENSELNNIQQSTKRNSNFFSFIDLLIKESVESKIIQDQSLGLWRSVTKHLKEFSPNLHVSDIDYSFLVAFENYLSNNGINQNTRHRYLKTFRQFCSEAYCRKKTKERPFENFKIKKGKSYRKALSIEEMVQLRDAILIKEAEEKTRFRFLVQCSTGMDYLSMFSLKWKNVSDTELSYVRKKTGAEITIPLNSWSKKLLSQLKRGNDEDFVFEYITNQKYNENLKDMASTAKLKKTITTHVGRHTFATVALNLGMRIETLSCIFGHNSIATTQIYAEILNSTKHTEMLLIDQALAAKMEEISTATKLKATKQA